MSEESMSFGASINYKPLHPERTARRGGDGVTFKTWRTREAMANAIRIEQKGPPHYLNWRPLIKLEDYEGFTSKSSRSKY